MSNKVFGAVFLFKTSEYLFHVIFSVDEEDSDCDCARCEREKDPNNSNAPVGNKDTERRWTEPDIRQLIKKWSSHDALYDSKNPLYYPKEEREKIIAQMQQELNNEGLNYTFKQVQEKMSNLRTYYGSQRRLVEINKDRNSNDKFVSKWKYFNELSFLYDHVTPRYSDESSSSSIAKNQAHAKEQSRKSPKPQRICEPEYPRESPYSIEVNDTFQKGYNSVESVLPVPVSVQSHRSSVYQTQDEIFGTLITRMISDIPDCQEKALLKLELQHKIVTFQYNVSPSCGRKKSP